MKIRLGYVSNSSSASFWVRKDMLTDWQVKAILDYKRFGEEFVRLNAFPDFNGGRLGFGDSWELSETKNGERIVGSTWMDNGEMEIFLKALGVKKKAYKIIDHN